MHQIMHQHISMSIITMMQSVPIVIETIEKENTHDQWWVHTCSTHVDPQFQIFLCLCTLEVFSTIQTSSTPLHSQTLKCPAHMSTISKHSITCPCVTHQYISKYLTSSTHVLQHVVKTFAHLQTHITLYPIIFQVYYITSLNIFLHKSSHTPNIWYYPCMACRIFTTPSKMFGHQFIWFLGIPNALICIPEYFYCARTCICLFASLHSSPSIQHLSPTSIKI